MNTMRMLLALAVAAPLAAQQPDSARRAMPMDHRMKHGHRGMPGMMGHQMDMMGPMHRGMAFAPMHLLEHKDALELTPQQVTRLTALQDAAKGAHDAAQTEMQTHMQAMTTVMKAANPDTNQLKQHFQALQTALGRAHWSMLSAAAQARGVLTDLQRGRVEGWADAMQGRMMPKVRAHPGGHGEHQPSRD